MASYFVGLDIHWKHTSVCVLDGNGNRIKRLTLRGSWTKIAEELKQLPGKVSVCFEASTAYGHLHELLLRSCRASRGGPPRAAATHLSQQAEE